MNIYVINGSPKGGRSNTYRLTKAFLEGIRRENPASQVRETAVSRTDVKPCLGCFACWNKAPGTCCIGDDMPQVLENMLWADVIVWSFPLYYFSVPGPLKNLMDRQLPMSMPFMSTETESGGHPSRYDMSGKRHVVISTCGFYTAKGNYDGVNAMFDHLCGKGNYTSIYCGQGELFRVKELSQRTDAYLNHVQQAGAEFCRGGITDATKHALAQLLYPREVFEAMADASWGVEKDGEKSDETLVFTRQMAALYRQSAWPGRDILLEIHYTDVDKRYQILLSKDGSRVLEGDFQKFTTRIETPFSLWKAIAAGEISGESALMEGKYRVKGDFDLMIYWNRYFGDEKEAPEEQPKMKQASTNMTILLLPWMILWIGTQINVFYGAIAAIIGSALVPVFYYRSRKTVYDTLSAAIVTVCGVLLLTGYSVGIILPASYLAFGIMWTVSCFLRIPLTAHYSMNDYNGDAALQNPLFMKTNWILTLCWGILYLLTAVWTVLLMPTAAGAWIGIVNSVLPALMGIFTAWFQKWYPAYLARR